MCVRFPCVCLLGLCACADVASPRRAIGDLAAAPCPTTHNPRPHRNNTGLLGAGLWQSTVAACSATTTVLARQLVRQLLQLTPEAFSDTAVLLAALDVQFCTDDGSDAEAMQAQVALLLAKGCEEKEEEAKGESKGGEQGYTSLTEQFTNVCFTRLAASVLPPTASAAAAAAAAVAASQKSGTAAVDAAAVKQIWNSSGSAASKAMAVWRPVMLTKDHVFFGDAVSSDHKRCDPCLVGIDAHNGLFAPPVSFELLKWQDDTGTPLRVWKPMAPTGFVALGYVFTVGGDGSPPKLPQLRCVKESATQKGFVEGEQKIWDSAGVEGPPDASFWELAGTGLAQLSATKDKPPIPPFCTVKAARYVVHKAENGRPQTIAFGGGGGESAVAAMNEGQALVTGKAFTVECWVCPKYTHDGDHSILGQQGFASAVARAVSTLPTRACHAQVSSTCTC